MKLIKELLDEYQIPADKSGEFRSCWNAKGLYSSMQFVLRLRPDVRRIIDNLPNGIISVNTLKFEEIQAFSTLLHETIHWWQHSGSTFGFIYSLSFPAQTHKIHDELMSYLRLTGAKKPIINYNKKYATEYHPVDDEFISINNILNDFHDIEFFKELTINQHNASEIIENNLFESVGHSFFITYFSIISSLAVTFDEEHNFLPDIRNWVDEIKRLSNEKVEGYYYGSTVKFQPIGVREIFEGQARFIQIQFLHFGSGGVLEWRDFEELGMLSGEYIKAFDLFLDLTNSTRPTSINSPLVGLFLLFCDISINPSDGFPFDICRYEDFVKNTDPGSRFCSLCLAVKNKFPELKYLIINYSASEYYYISKILCDELMFNTPLACSEKVISWAIKSDSLKEIMNEEETFAFKDINLPIRLLLSRFIRFNEDKFKHPEFFCWAGAWTAGERCSEFASELFNSNQALFSDKEDGDIYPIKIAGKEEKNIKQTFNSFYGWNLLYDLTRQLVVGTGEFKYDYFWLTSKYDRDELKQWSSILFESVYGVRPDDFDIIE